MPLRVNNALELLVICEEFVKKSGIGAARFSVMAANDMGFLSKLRHQPHYTPRLSTVTKVLNYIEAMTEAQNEMADGL